MEKLKTESKKTRAAKIIIDPALDKFNDTILFKEKLELVKELFLLPKLAPNNL